MNQTRLDDDTRRRLRDNKQRRKQRHVNPPSGRGDEAPAMTEVIKPKTDYLLMPN